MGRNKKKNKNRQNQHYQSDSPPASAARDPHKEKRDENKDSGVVASPFSSSGSPATLAAAATTVFPTMECDICKEEYDGGKGKPRNLECGHTFCSNCCLSMVHSKGIICPKCRKETSVYSVDKLPVNYPLLELMKGRDATGSGSMKVHKGMSFNKDIPLGPQKEEASPHKGKCLEAQAEVAMHCAHCDLWLCKDCSRIDHRRRECLLVPYQETLKEKIQAGKASIRASQQVLEEFYCEANKYGTKLRSCAAILEIALDCIKKEQSQLPDVLIQCRKLEQELSDIAVKRVPNDLEEALCFLGTLEECTQATVQWTADASTSVLKMDHVFRLSKTLLQTAVQMHATTSGVMMGLHSINGVNMTLPVDMDGSRLLVHAMQHGSPTSGCRVVKFELIKSCIDPSCALTFLDISLREQELGRVFIRLLGSTKRSRCFLLMCTGEIGYSFRGTLFHRVWWAGQPGEHLWTGDYDHGDGTGGSLPRTMQDKIKELSNEKTQVAVNAGLIAARYGDTNSTIFRVYTRESSDAVEEFALGRVEYGLEVFKDALKMNKNITDLKISGCGVVVER